VDAPNCNLPTARAAMAMAKAQAYQDAADAPATLRAYASDLKNYEAWCARHGLTALPATPEVVGAYLAAAGEGYAMQTLRRRVAAIARASGVSGHPLDTKHPAIRETLRGIGRTHGSRGRRSAALTTSELKKLSHVCDPGLAGDRDRACSSITIGGSPCCSSRRTTDSPARCPNRSRLFATSSAPAVKRANRATRRLRAVTQFRSGCPSKPERSRRAFGL